MKHLTKMVSILFLVNDSGYASDDSPSSSFSNESSFSRSSSASLVPFGPLDEDIREKGARDYMMDAYKAQKENNKAEAKAFLIKAGKLYEEEAQKSGGRIFHWQCAANAYREAGQEGKAIRLLQKAGDLYIEDANITSDPIIRANLLMTAGELYADTHDEEEATKTFTLAAELYASEAKESREWHLYENAANAYKKAGRDSLAKSMNDLLEIASVSILVGYNTEYNVSYWFL
ncbi:MAG: hypothetical protein NTX76_01410 [Alphaproteobacteria bacterium]|nr:hypothetical protein [Alphaproteobacteria bacterium]